MAEKTGFWSWFPEAPFLLVGALGVLATVVYLFMHEGGLIVVGIGVFGAAAYYAYKGLKNKGKL